MFYGPPEPLAAGPLQLSAARMSRAVRPALALLAAAATAAAVGVGPGLAGLVHLVAWAVLAAFAAAAFTVGPVRPRCDRLVLAALAAVGAAAAFDAALLPPGAFPARPFALAAFCAAAARALLARVGAAGGGARSRTAPPAAARVLQRALFPLPAIFPAPCRPAVRCDCSPAVAGDLLVALPDPDPASAPGVRFGCLLVDPPGEGIEAVTLAARVQLAARARASEAPHPAAFLSGLAADLAPGLRPRLLTALCVWVDLSDGRLRVAAAGHLPPLLVRGGLVDVLSVSGPAVGLKPSPVYDELDVRLLSGDRLVLATDGFVRQTAPGGEPYGEARFKVELVRSAADPSALAVDLLFADVAGWCGHDAPFDDDLLAVVFDVPPLCAAPAPVR